MRNHLLEAMGLVLHERLKERRLVAADSRSGRRALFLRHAVCWNTPIPGLLTATSNLCRRFWYLVLFHLDTLSLVEVTKTRKKGNKTNKNSWTDRRFAEKSNVFQK